MTPTEALFLFLLLYFFPSEVAFARHGSWRWMALFANAFFGWMIVGWLVALILAFHAREARA